MTGQETGWINMIRKKEIEVNIHGSIMHLELEDDGYRISAKVISGGKGNLPNGISVLWTDYKQCDFPSIGYAIADYLMKV